MPNRMLSRAVSALGPLLLTSLALVMPSPALADNEGLGFRVDGTPGSTLEAGFITLHVPAGGSASGHFIITNTESVSVPLAVYPADGLTATTTGVVYGDQDDPLSGTGAWLKPDIGGAVMQPRTERNVDFTVQVPAGAEAGDHVGAIVLQQSRPGSASSGAGAITQVVRNVIPVMVDVTGAAAPQVLVRSASITTLPGTSLPAITVSLRNSGLRLCRPVLAVAMDGPSESGTPVSRQLDTILPGDRAPYPLLWPKKITSGTYIVDVTASGCGATRTFKVTAKTPDDLATDAPTKSNTGGGKKPSVVTDADPGTTRFEAPTASTTKPKGTKRKKRRSDSGDGQGISGAGINGRKPPGNSGPGGGGLVGRGATGGGTNGDGWLAKAADALKVNAPAVLERATVPLLVLALIGLIFIAQEAIDRRDPKLALAPLHREPHLPFDSNPLATRQVVPLPTLAVGDG